MGLPLDVLLPSSLAQRLDRRACGHDARRGKARQDSGLQPCRGIAWWADRDDVRRREDYLAALPRIFIGSVDLNALKISARRAEYSDEPRAPPIHFRLNQHTPAAPNIWSQTHSARAHDTSLSPIPLRGQAISAAFPRIV